MLENISNNLQESGAVMGHFFFIGVPILLVAGGILQNRMEWVYAGISALFFAFILRLYIVEVVTSQQAHENDEVVSSSLPNIETSVSWFIGIVTIVFLGLGIVSGTTPLIIIGVLLGVVLLISQYTSKQPLNIGDEILLDDDDRNHPLG